ncbi:MAG: ATP-grasp peptide maturase system methyltransferase [Pseudonocardiaceae bacterium]
MTDIDSLQAAFVDALKASGAMRDQKLLAAFRDIPRGPFVPYYFTQTPDHSGWVLVEHPDPQWAEEVYSNKPLITQLNGDDTLTEAAREGQTVNGVSTSSSSAPSLMALMLEALDVHDGNKILEIGTGTGYNTALLCHRVGAGHVTSIDIDHRLVDNARERLAAFGYLPYLATLDGTAGCAARTPFDRVIATVGVPSVPPEWITQTRVGGVILLPLDRRNCGGLLARLTVHSGDVAQGHFLPDFGGFMPVRPLHRHDASDHAFRTTENGQGDTRHTSLPPDVITQEASPFEFFAALTIPGGGWNHLTFTPSNGNPTETWLAQEDGSWVCHTTANDTHTVRQGGPTQLWDHVEIAYHQWHQIGQPTRDRFGLTIHHGQHTIWLDHPDSPHQWTLLVY